MSSSLISLPVWILAGAREFDGIVRVCETELVLEFEHGGGLLDLFESSVKEVAVPFDEIESVGLQAGLFRDTLVISVKSLSAASGVPGSRRGQIMLRTARRDRKKTKETESMLAFGLARRDLRGLSAELARHGEDAPVPRDTF